MARTCEGKTEHVHDYSIHDLKCERIQGSLKNKEACPRLASENPMGQPKIGMFPVHAGGDMYAAFDVESEFQVKDYQFRRPGAKRWKNIILYSCTRVS